MRFGPKIKYPGLTSKQQQATLLTLVARTESYDFVGFFFVKISFSFWFDVRNVCFMG
jgi:hypothetical protein